MLRCVNFQPGEIRQLADFPVIGGGLCPLQARRVSAKTDNCFDCPVPPAANASRRSDVVWRAFSRPTALGANLMEGRLNAFRQWLNSPGMKMFFIAGLIVLLMIPLLFVWMLIDERAGRAQDVASQIAREWGKQQTVNGPFLVVPYTITRVRTRGDKEVEEDVERQAVFLPSKTEVEADAETKVLSRSIYDVTVYSSALSMSGRFDAPDVLAIAPDARRIRWEDAFVAVSISDVSGLKSVSGLKTGAGPAIAFEPSLGMAGRNAPGIHAPLKNSVFATPAGISAFDFDISLKLDGSSGLRFTPSARDTTVSLKSPWPHPSFTGNFLPTKRAVTDAGFTARWQIPNLARSVPHAWTMGSSNGRSGAGPDRWLSPFAFGVDFYIPLDVYDLASRAAKYALMFLATVFMAVFLLEMRSSKPVHVVQYLFVGLAMVFFYVLLLALAEHTGFEAAYLSAAGATSLLLAIYVGKQQHRLLSGLIMLVVLSLVYGLLYLILRLERYALLAGALTGFVLLAGAMFATLKVDWWGGEPEQDDKGKAAGPWQPAS